MNIAPESLLALTQVPGEQDPKATFIGAETTVGQLVEWQRLLQKDPEAFNYQNVDIMLLPATAAMEDRIEG